tara:strand:- start:834 stop:1103 length:270 start_codon:yes stop_codon:yes gene_type:complete
MKKYAQFIKVQFEQRDGEEINLLLNIKDLLFELNGRLEHEIEVANAGELTINHTDLQQGYPMFSLRSDITDLAYQVLKLTNLLILYKTD